MLSLLRRLFRAREEQHPGHPMETLTASIAYPDGRKETSYISEAVLTAEGDAERAALLAELREAYPHIAERISLTWGTPNCEEYLASLLFDERAMDKDHQYVARNGFTPRIMSVLMTLQGEHQHCFCFSPGEMARQAS